jgi:hydroxymethylpyrimidine pyrophosphatase-like HAD family hydrolase
MPIIAIDFDDTININGAHKYPVCGEVRPCAKEVINFMHKLGIKIVIWTSRDVAYNQDEKQIYDHVSPMIEWMDANEIHYDAINKSIQFAPYHYNGRKVYAHMYVDDRAFGWDDYYSVFYSVLESFLKKVCGFNNDDAYTITMHCSHGFDPEEWMIEGVKNWKKD